MGDRYTARGLAQHVALGFLLANVVACGSSSRGNGAGGGGESTGARAGASGTAGAGGNGANGGTGAKDGNGDSGGSTAVGGDGNSGAGGSIGGSGATAGRGGGSGGGGGTSGGSGTSGGGGTGGGSEPTACLTDAIDVPTAVVTGTITVAGGTISANYGNVALSNGDDMATLGATDSGTYSVRVVPGTYDALYVGTRNGTHPLGRTIDIAPSGITTFDIDIPAATTTAPGGITPAPSGFEVTLSGRVLVNGEEYSNTSGVTLFQSVAGSAPGYSWERFAPVDQGTYSGKILAGTYDLSYLDIDGVPNVEAPFPTNSGMPVVLTGVVVEPTDYVELDIDISSSTVTGTVTLDGADASNAYVALTHPLLGIAAIHQPGAPAAFSTQVIPGTYDVLYVYGSTGPANTSTVLRSGVEVSPEGGTVIDIDVPSVAVAGNFTIDGATITEKNDSGTVSLHAESGGEIVLGTTASGSYSTTVIPGTYDIYYAVEVPLQASLAPLNTRGKVKSGVVLAPGAPITLDIDVVTTVINGTLEIAGMTVNKETDGGRIWLRDGLGDEVPIGWTSSGKFSARVVPGTYDVFYQGTAASNLAPRNTAAKLGCMQVR